MASADRYPSRRHVAWRVLDAEALVVDPKAGLIYPLNAVAARIWQLCDGMHAVDAIIATLVDEFEAARETVTADVNAFIEDLRTAGLITLHEKPHPIEHEQPLGRRGQEATCSTHARRTRGSRTARCCS